MGCGGEVSFVSGYDMSFGRSRYPDMLLLKLCARCGGALWAWLEGLGEEGGEGMPGPVKDQRRLCEDRVPSEEIESDELMADGIRIAVIPKHPHSTESRTDRRPSPETASDRLSRSPRVASKLSEEWRWSGL